MKGRKSRKEQFEEVKQAIDAKGEFRKSMSPAGARALVSSMRYWFKNRLRRNIVQHYDHDEGELTLTLAEE